MTEKRKSKRINVDMKLKISDLFKQDNIKIEDIDAPIHVTNMSKGGIGFETKAILPTGYYFNTKLIDLFLNHNSAETNSVESIESVSDTE